MCYKKATNFCLEQYATNITNQGLQDYWVCRDCFLLSKCFNNRSQSLCLPGLVTEDQIKVMFQKGLKHLGIFYSGEMGPDELGQVVRLIRRQNTNILIEIILYRDISQETLSGALGVHPDIITIRSQCNDATGYLKSIKSSNPHIFLKVNLMLRGEINIYEQLWKLRMAQCDIVVISTNGDYQSGNRGAKLPVKIGERLGFLNITYGQGLNSCYNSRELLKYLNFFKN